MSAINPTFTDRYRDAVVDLISGSITANSLNLSGNLFVAGDTEIQGNAIIDDIVSLSGKVRWDNGTSDGLSGANSVSIGNLAGKTTQGVSSIAIGKQAGETSQHDNSIVLNASGSALNTNGTSRFFVNPIRSSSTSVTYPLYYTPSTSEVTYAPITTAVSLAGTTGDYYEIAIPTDCTRMVISGLDVVHTGSTYGKFEFGDATQWYGYAGSGNPAYYIGQFSQVRSDLGINRDLWSSLGLSGVPINIILTSSPLTFTHRFEYMGYDGTTYYNWICSSESYYFTSFYNTGNSCGYARTPVKPTRIRLALTGGSGDYTGGLLRVLFF